MSHVSVVIPCRNEAAHIRRVLEALTIQDAAIGDIIVVDGGSTDGTLSIIDACQNEVPSLPICVISQPDAAIPAALNVAIRHARGDIIVRVDAHSRPSPDTVSRTVHALQDSSVGVVGGVWDVVPGAETIVARVIAWAVAHPWGAGDAAYRIASKSIQLRDVDTVPGACFWKALWEELGGFNEQLWNNEDYEFNYRVRSSGRRVLLDPAIRSTYVARPTIAELATQYFRYGWWKAEMLWRHPASIRWRQILPILFLAVLAVLVAASPVDRRAFSVLLLILASYQVTTGLISARIGARHHSWSAVPILILVFGVVHFAWAGGALLNILTCRRWPRWTLQGPQFGRAGRNRSTSASATVHSRR